LITMRRLPSIINENDDDVDRRQMMALMLALEENRLPWAESSDTTSIAGGGSGNHTTTATASPKRQHVSVKQTQWEDDFDIVYDLVEESLTMEDDVETYWLCRSLHKILTQRKKLLQAQMKEIEAYILRKDATLAAHLEEGQFWRWPSTSSAIMDFLRLAFAGVFRCEAVVCLWDKIVAGSSMSSVFVLAEILISHRSSILTTPVNLVAKKVELIIKEIPLINQHAIIDRAMEIWQTEFNGVLQPNLLSPAAGLPVIVASNHPVNATASSMPAISSSTNEIRPHHKMSMDATNTTNSRVLKTRKFSHFMKL